MSLSSLKGQRNVGNSWKFGLTLQELRYFFLWS